MPETQPMPVKSESLLGVSKPSCLLQASHRILVCSLLYSSLTLGTSASFQLLKSPILLTEIPCPKLLRICLKPTHKPS